MAQLSDTPCRNPRTDPARAVLPDGSPVVRIADIIRGRAAATPDRVALIEPDGGTTTYAELDVESNRVAQALLASGVGVGDRVTFIGANGPQFLAVVYGASKVGAIASAVNNRLAGPEVSAILADSEPTVVVLGEAEAQLRAVVAAVPSVRTFVALEPADGEVGYRDWLADHLPRDPGCRADPDATAILMYTSGTTGTPKGIELSGNNFGHALAVLCYDVGLGVESVQMAPIPFFHIAGLGVALVGGIAGSALLLDSRSDPDELRRMLLEHRVTHATLVPTLIQRLVDLPETASSDWSALEYILYGAAPIPMPVIERATRVIGCKFMQSYGLSESTGGFTALWPEDHFPPEDKDIRRTSVGRPMPGQSVRIVDPVTLDDVGPHELGEVLVGGPRVMKGYWRRPEPTAEAVLPGGWLRTGDGATFDEDGFVYLHARLKDMIVSGGENIYPAEVESALSGHPDIVEVAVVGIESDRWGESPMAVVVTAPGSALTEAAVVDYARTRLARFKCPTVVRFVDALPRTASGKIRKVELRESVV
jgi:acyl-CoA synthetase (AMP-forming)/AMP-acid ligase II